MAADPETHPVTLGACAPLLIVSDLDASVDHYVQRLGFACRARADGDGIFAMVGRDAAQILLKVIGPEVPPRPNPMRHPWAPWDVFVYVEDPDGYARELAGRGCAVHTPLSNRDDGLRGFAVADPDGYVAFFGRPLAA